MKSKTRLALVSIAALLLMTIPLSAAEPDDIVGTWETPEGKSHVEIYKNGKGYFGKIVKLGEPTYPADDEQGMGGQERIDRNNPDEDLRTRPIVGLEILQGLEASKGAWKGGTIYDPEKGKTYKCQATLDGDTLKLRGYIGFSLVGRTSEWARLKGGS